MLTGSGFGVQAIRAARSSYLPQKTSLFAVPLPQVPGFGGDPLNLSAATIGVISDALEKGRLDEVIPAVSASADGVGIMYPDDAYGWFTRVCKERAPSWRNEVRIGALAEPFNPIEFLVTQGRRCAFSWRPDKLTPPQAGMKVASTIPMIDVVQIAGGHFDAYESGFAESSQQAIDWFARHLKT
ncbi:MAG: hypothetical protein WDN50_18475 [Bradyrhizobium sp.]